LLLAEIEASGNQVQTASALCRDATRVAEDLGMRPLLARCHATQASLYRRTGAIASAQEHSTMAITMFREMGMTYWLEKETAESRTS
jgi:hypothetical protein